MAPAPADDWEDFNAWDHEYGADIRLPPAERGGSLPFLADAYAALDRGGAVGQGPGRDGRQFRIKFLGSCYSKGCNVINAGYVWREGFPVGLTRTLLLSNCANCSARMGRSM